MLTKALNIWSHLIGTLLFSLVPLYRYYKVTSRYVYATESDKFAVFTYFASVSACFLLSSSFHALMNHSPRIAYFVSARSPGYRSCDLGLHNPERALRLLLQCTFAITLPVPGDCSWRTVCNRNVSPYVSNPSRSQDQSAALHASRSIFLHTRRPWSSA